ncbi:hypothetical protein BX264_4373 [Streptomyces sp. 2333.5]|uniref:hypothetical protein n=1 Tax=unclassified Streptomyces TaxID=2593676 RepID=UPI00089D4930|nr:MULTISPECIES: hypothetical protein [unclassified Streptomyces]PJJ03971.1 hypothetical protein BX264_4373 [Streptomyces sp. 2333.5]SEE38025.1 hypothetical protein SAMN05428943_4544 [Streptomyces sp. 2314.4]SEE64311.1 hypothetical protein SAMN05428942_4474 [Streptomyces sp. 2112.2]
MVDAKQEYDNAKAMEQQRKNHEREERLKSFKGQHLTPRSPSDFHHHGIDALRAMIANANPEAIETSGHHWRASADRLGGEDGQGGIRKSFMDAVEHATAHWEGSAAQAFRREAGKVLEKIDRTYQHSRNVESTLIGSRSSGPEVGVAHNLREAKATMSKIHDPGLVDRAKDDSGDDSQFKQDMQNPKMDTRMALELNRDNLSLSKERQVEAVIVMDELAAHYDGQGKRLNDGIEPGGPGDDWPKPPSSHPAPPPVRMPVIGGTHPKDSSSGSDAPNGAGGHAVPKGFDSPHHVARPEVPVTTGLDSVQGGTLTPPSVGGGISGGTAGGAHGMPGGAGGGFPGGAFASGAIGAAGALGAGGMRGGMPGAGLGAGKAGAAGAAGRGGPQARTRGGLVGKPGGPAGGAKQGGSGLHRSRGGKQAGMVGAAGAKGKGKGDNKERGQRPDYLVEDEETWTPERQVAPRVIE